MADATRFQVLSKQIEEPKQATDSISTQIEKLTQSQAQIDKLLQSQQKMEAMMAALMSQRSSQLSRPPDPPYSASGDLTSYSQAPQPPDPPDCKSEFPEFDGTLLQDWFRRCDQYFYLHKTPPEMRVRIASPHVIGKALQWHTNYIINNFGMFPPWPDYTIAISAEFGDNDALLMHQSSLSPYHNQNNQSHYKIPNTTSLLLPLETTKALPYKPNLPTEINMENSPRKLSHEEIQESEMRVWCESSDGSYANGHHLESKKSQVFVKGCEVASMSGYEANYKTNSVLEKETFPSSELRQRVPATQAQGNNVTQQEEVPILSLEPSQFDVTTIADDVWIAKRCESSLLQHSSATKVRAPSSPYQNYSNQPYYERRFGKCPEIEFDRNSDEIKDEKLQGKQPEEDVKTLVISENEQFLECDDEESFNVEKSGEITAEGTAIELLGKSGYKVFKEGYLDSLLLHFKESSEDAINQLKKLLAIMGGLAQKISCGLLCGDSKFHLKHKWKSRLSQSFSELKQRMVSVWKSLGYLMEAHGSRYEGLGCLVEKKKLRNVEDGVRQDKNRFSRDVRAKIFMVLEELHLLHGEEKRDAHTLLLVEAILDVACSSMERKRLWRITLRETDSMGFTREKETVKKSVKVDAKKGKNRLLADGKIILALAVKEYMIGKADGMPSLGRYGLLPTFDRCGGGGLNATVIAGTIMQSSLKSLDQFRVACLHNTSLGFLYGSLPRPPEENHSNFITIES